MFKFLRIRSKSGERQQFVIFRHHCGVCTDIALRNARAPLISIFAMLVVRIGRFAHLFFGHAMRIALAASQLIVSKYPHARLESRSL